MGLFSLQTANSAIIATDLSTTVMVPGISQFVTNGAEMAGMSVTVNFGGGSETVQWAATGPVSGAVDSANGLDFVSTLLGDADVVATYSSVVGIGATPPVTDLFQVLTVSFSDEENGTVSGLFNFTQDTDSDIRIQIPEPAMLPLFGLGLASLAIIARKRAA